MRGMFAAVALLCSACPSPRIVYAQASAPATSTQTVSGAPAAPTPEDKKAASDAFREGDRAYRAGDYRRAAQEYETAYKRAPHHAPLWNAARAWDRAGELPRAANLYSKYLREAPANAPDRNSATTSLKKLTSKLARIDVHAAKGLEDVTVDGQAFEGDSVYVLPGQHVVEARVAQSAAERVRQSPQVEAGDAVSVALLAPSAPPPKVMPALAPPPPSIAPSRGWSPAIVAFGGAVTAITTGLAIWSGFDTIHQRDVFDGARTQDNLDSGHAKQTRTNILIVASAGVGVLTAACAIFLVDWHAPSSEKAPTVSAMELGLSPQQLLVRGRF